jgi:hypothetical protein
MSVTGNSGTSKRSNQGSIAEDNSKKRVKVSLHEQQNTQANLGDKQAENIFINQLAQSLLLEDKQRKNDSQQPSSPNSSQNRTAANQPVVQSLHNPQQDHSLSRQQNPQAEENSQNPVVPESSNSYLSDTGLSYLSEDQQPKKNFINPLYQKLDQMILDLENNSQQPASPKSPQNRTAANQPVAHNAQQDHAWSTQQNPQINVVSQFFPVAQSLNNPEATQLCFRPHINTSNQPTEKADRGQSSRQQPQTTKKNKTRVTDAQITALEGFNQLEAIKIELSNISSIVGDRNRPIETYQSVVTALVDNIEPLKKIIDESFTLSEMSSMLNKAGKSAPDAIKDMIEYLCLDTTKSKLKSLFKNGGITSLSNLSSMVKGAGKNAPEVAEELIEYLSSNGTKRKLKTLFEESGFTLSDMSLKFRNAGKKAPKAAEELIESLFEKLENDKKTT